VGISEQRRNSPINTRSGQAGDALHLATASEHGATVFALDQKLAEAGLRLGVPTQLLTWFKRGL